MSRNKIQHFHPKSNSQNNILKGENLGKRKVCLNNPNCKANYQVTKKSCLQDTLRFHVIVANARHASLLCNVKTISTELNPINNLLNLGGNMIDPWKRGKWLEEHNIWSLHIEMISYLVNKDTKINLCHPDTKIKSYSEAIL